MAVVAFVVDTVVVVNSVVGVLVDCIVVLLGASSLVISSVVVFSSIVLNKNGVFVEAVGSAVVITVIAVACVVDIVVVLNSVVDVVSNGTFVVLFVSSVLVIY